jgi:teichuronic acid biosynthesis glycosyltransferase TuaC
MQILTYTSLFPNAENKNHGVFIYQRILHLSRRPGVNVTVVAPVPYFPPGLRMHGLESVRKIPSEEIIDGLKIYHPRYPLIPKISMPLHGFLMHAGSLRLVRWLHSRLKFDCIDAHYVYPDGFAATLIAKRLNIPLVVSARGSDINQFPSIQLIRPMIRWTLREASGAIAVCAALRDAMVELGSRKDTCRVIGNGVDLNRFQALDRAEARTQLGIPQDAKMILSVGALLPVKGHSFTISAVAQLCRHRPKVRLYIVGEGKSRRELLEMIDALNLTDRVFLVGSKPNESLSSWYSAADVNCLASSREGWANVLLESMACGTPVVATRVWGTPDVVTSPELGILVDQKVESIASALDSALSKDWNRAFLVEYASRRQWDDVAAEVEEFLASTIGRNQDRSDPSR